MNILSGCNKLRFHSKINHEVYTNIHNYNYINDGKKRKLKSKFDHKIHAILDIPVDDQWWFWIDDDAFFTNFDLSIESLNLPFDNNLFVFAESPINSNGGYAFLCSGNFFFKNTQTVKDFFIRVLNRDIEEVKDWWDESKLGMFTNGDQDRIIYELLHDKEIFSNTQILPFEKFNTRPYHYSKHTDHFLVHFSGIVNKWSAIREFKDKFNFPNETLVPTEYRILERNLIKSKLENLKSTHKTEMYEHTLKEFLSNLKEK